jgi:hypothetical protein
MHAPQAAPTTTVDIPPAHDTGALGISQLKRLWARNAAARAGQRFPVNHREKHPITW